MDIFVLLFIALGLSVDSFAVSVVNGLTIQNLSLSDKFKIAFTLSIFQAIMPFLGWYSGNSIEEYIKEFDHWVAFILLALIGLKMIYDSFHENILEKQKSLKTSMLLAQSLATSIDAFAIGIGFALLDTPIILPVIIIGVITFIASITGLQLGKIIGLQLGKYIEIFGGIVLIGIGFKILIEHTLN